MVNDKIVIRGAREHNLKDINLSIPRTNWSLLLVCQVLGKVL